MAPTSACEQEDAIPFTIQGLQDECSKIEKDIKYSVCLDSGRINKLQDRFAKLPTKYQASEQACLDRAADLAWAVRSRETQRQNEEVLPSVPPAFHFDGFVFLSNVIATIISAYTRNRFRCATRMHLRARYVT